MIFSSLIAAFSPGVGGQEVASDAKVKAAFMVNFAKFLEWPSDAFSGRDAPLTLCVTGRGPVGAALSAYERRLVQSRELRVRRSVTPEELRGCHMVYVGEFEERHMLQILRAAAGLPLVTVSDIDGFADAGGTIGLVEAEQRVQFEVNIASAQRANVRVSSQLLRLARNTRGKLQ